MKINSIWISDPHLGSHHSQAECLLRLLKTIEIKKIFLVGDVVESVNGFTYMNCGDWTGNNSFLVEMDSGEFKIIK